jgi:hypothetical protein
VGTEWLHKARLVRHGAGKFQILAVQLPQELLGPVRR